LKALVAGLARQPHVIQIILLVIEAYAPEGDNCM
jgi:hypothetical protein